MSEGFDKKDLEVSSYNDEVKNLLKKYKKIKKYMKSPLYAIKEIDGTENIVSNLLKELDTNK